MAYSVVAKDTGDRESYLSKRLVQLGNATAAVHLYPQMTEYNRRDRGLMGIFGAGDQTPSLIEFAGCKVGGPYSR